MEIIAKKADVRKIAQKKYIKEAFVKILSCSKRVSPEKPNEIMLFAYADLKACD